MRPRRPPCTEAGCANLSEARGLCRKHYRRLRLQRIPLPPLKIPNVPSAPLRAFLGDRGIANTLGRGTYAERSAFTPFLTIYRADDLAIALGVHPIEIWIDWYELDAAFGCYADADDTTEAEAS